MFSMGLLKGWMRAINKGTNRRRGSLTPKTLPSGWIKGRGVRNIGRITSKGKFIIEPKKLLQLEVPDLTNCELKPYVSHSTPRNKGDKPPLPKYLKAGAEKKKQEQARIKRKPQGFSGYF